MLVFDVLKILFIDFTPQTINLIPNPIYFCTILSHNKYIASRAEYMSGRGQYIASPTEYMSGQGQYIFINAQFIVSKNY
jgi:hypothetical protein